MEWILAEQSCNAYNLTLCPIYDTLGADSVEFILQQTEMKACVCAPSETPKLLTLIDRAPDLKVIVQIGSIDPKMRAIAEQHVRRIDSLLIARASPCSPRKN